MKAVVFLFATLVGLFPETDQTDRTVAQSERAYVTAVQAYAACRDEEAVRGIESVTSSYKMAVEHALAPRSNVKELGAALLLHLRLAESPSDGQWEHDLVVSHVAERLLAFGPPQAVGGVTYGLLVIKLQHEERISRVMQVLSRMPQRYRGELAALLATASLHELLSTPMVSPETLVFADEPLVGTPHPPPPLDEWGQNLFATARRGNRANRDRAIALYGEATRLWPSDAEAYLRLAFLFTEDGRFAEADAALLAARPLTKPPVLSYYESLVAARSAERQSRSDDALAAYIRAAALAPHAQTPLLASARLLFLRGETASARQFLTARLDSTSPAQSDDPWWEMTFGQTWRRQQYTQRLDQLVRACGS